MFVEELKENNDVQPRLNRISLLNPKVSWYSQNCEKKILTNRNKIKFVTVGSCIYLV